MLIFTTNICTIFLQVSPKRQARKAAVTSSFGSPAHEGSSSCTFEKQLERGSFIGSMFAHLTSIGRPWNTVCLPSPRFDRLDTRCIESLRMVFARLPLLILEHPSNIPVRTRAHARPLSDPMSCAWLSTTAPTIFLCEIYHSVVSGLV